MQRFILRECHEVMKYFFLLAAVCLLSSCTKDRSCESCIKSNAKIVWTGPVESDGCSWAIVINDTYYHAATLSPDFQQDQLNVIVEYQITTDRFICGIAGIGYPIINVTRIKRQ